MSLLEGLIEAISPGWAANRSAARAMVERNRLAMRGFNAVSKGRRITEEWRNTMAGGPTESDADIATLRARATEMARNNPYWKNGRRIISNETVGSGIRATAAGTNKRTNDSLQADWDAWAASRHVDVAGRLDWYAVQRLVWLTVVNDGEVLVRRRVTRDGNLQLQLLGADFLANDRDGPIDGGEIVGGVELDDFGAAVAYHLYRRHPSSQRGSVREVVRVPASEVRHVFLIERPGQLRGESWISTVFTRLMDWDDYEDAELLRQKLAACFGMVYTGVEAPPNGAGENELLDKIEPGMIEHLPQGAEVQTISPPASQGMMDTARITQRGVATGLGITYESLTGDYGNVTFSSARMGRLMMLANIAVWQEHLIDQLCDPVWSWFLEARTLQRESVLLPLVPVKWAAPRPVLVNPDQEYSADIKRVRGGFDAWSTVVREHGGDPDQVADAIAEDMKRWDDRGIVLDCDPRKVSAQGQGATNQKQENEGSNDASSKAKPKAA